MKTPWIYKGRNWYTNRRINWTNFKLRTGSRRFKSLLKLKSRRTNYNKKTGPRNSPSMWQPILESQTSILPLAVRITCRIKTSEEHGSSKIRRIKWPYRPRRDRRERSRHKKAARARHHPAVPLPEIFIWKPLISQLINWTQSSLVSQWLQGSPSTTNITIIAPQRRTPMEHAQE